MLTFTSLSFDGDAFTVYGTLVVPEIFPASSDGPAIDGASLAFGSDVIKSNQTSLFSVGAEELEPAIPTVPVPSDSKLASRRFMALGR